MAIIRPAKETDIEGIQQVARTAWFHAYSHMYSIEYMEGFLDKAYSEAALATAIQRDDAEEGPRLFYVAVDAQDRVIGYAHARNRGDGIYEIMRIYIAPTFQGQGVGSMLLQEITSKAAGMNRLRAWAEKNNRSGARFYEKHQFLATDEKEEVIEGTPVRLVLYEKKIEEEYYWDRNIDYLTQTRDLYYNDDYLEFLVEKVWRIKKPVKLIDFGCGYGYLGLKLLPLLPAQSTYTGIDKGNGLIREARSRFKQRSNTSEFIVADIEEVEVERKYDIAMCHAVLLHMPDVRKVLRKMADCVVDGGKLICFEPHWIANMSSYGVDEVEPSSIVKLGILQQLYERDAKTTGKDGNVGGKLPMYFSQLGLQDVQCRVSDKVNVLAPNMEVKNKENLYRALRAEGLGASPGHQEEVVRSLVSRGLTEQQAQEQYEAELRFAEAFHADSYLSYAPSMKITFGTVRRAPPQ